MRLKLSLFTMILFSFFVAFPLTGNAQQGMPPGGMPQGGMPQGGMPQGGMPPGGMPPGGMPQGSGMPQGAYGGPGPGQVAPPGMYGSPVTGGSASKDDVIVDSGGNLKMMPADQAAKVIARDTPEAQQAQPATPSAPRGPADSRSLQPPGRSSSLSNNPNMSSPVTDDVKTSALEDPNSSFNKLSPEQQAHYKSKYDPTSKRVHPDAWNSPPASGEASQ